MSTIIICIAITELLKLYRQETDLETYPFVTILV